MKGATIMPRKSAPRAAIYVRVSSRQQLDGTSLEDQERICRQFATDRGFDVRMVYRDEAKSAYSDELQKRPAFSQMLNAAAVRRFDAVIVYKLDRFARKARIYHNAKHELEKVGVTLFSATEPAEETAAGRLSSGMLAEFAEFYSRQLSERVKLSLASRAASGRWVGDVPFGYRRNKKAAEGIEPDPATRMWPLIIFVAYLEGYKVRDIADALNQTNIRLRHGRPWHRDAVYNILQNPAYMGLGRAGELGAYQSNHTPLVPAALWRRAEKLRLARKTRGGRQIQTWPVARPRRKRDYIPHCALCDKVMHRSTSGETIYKHGYWRCKNVECQAKGVRIDIVDSQVAALRAGGTVIERVWIVYKRGVERFE
jgi:site-specific DNA recombinase